MGPRWTRRVRSWPRSRSCGIVVTMYANIDLSGCETTTPREAEKRRVTKAGLNNLRLGRLNSKYCVAEGTVAATRKDLDCDWRAYTWRRQAVANRRKPRYQCHG